LGYLYAAGSDLRSGAAVFSSPPVTRAQLIADLRPGSRTGIAIANDTDANAQYMLLAKNPAGVVVASATVPVAARSNVARFADELLVLPTGFLGAVEVNVSGRRASLSGYYSRTKATTKTQRLKETRSPELPLQPEARAERAGS
jgi:hypothetical protein